MAQIENLPYLTNSNQNNKRAQKHAAQFLLKKIKSKIKEQLPNHYLIFHRADKLLKVIHDTSKKYPYFLRLDVEKFYPSISHLILIHCLSDLLSSRQGKRILKQIILPFLAENNLQNKGLPLGNYLSWVLAGFYLLPLDEKLSSQKHPFLQIHDDYLIFCKNKKEPLKILKEIIEPILNQLELKINVNKLQSGRFHRDELNFLGFCYKGGAFTIENSKIENFKTKIIKITHLTKKKPTEAIIKQLNNQILGFGHYYKFGQVKNTFANADAFIRQRLRRYLCRNKDAQNKFGNLIFTNDQLKSLGLKSLMEIYQKYYSKNTLILENSKKKTSKTNRFLDPQLAQKLTQNIDNYYVLGIYKNLKEITKKISKIEKKLQKIKTKVAGEEKQ